MLQAVLGYTYVAINCDIAGISGWSCVIPVTVSCDVAGISGWSCVTLKLRSVVMLQAILAGDYILSVLSTVLARIGNPEVVSIMSQVVEDLVRGE